jgi:dTDP-4-dehydrorhamnose reductase
MRILVTGYNGQLGYGVVKQGLQAGLSMYGVGRQELDITNQQDVTYYIKHLKPDAIIHCAAYTEVDKAEDDQKVCWDVNVNGTKYLAKKAKSVQAKFMYISTDYVFDGTGEAPYIESDETNPLGYYGLTKLEGEKVVNQLIDQSFIVRVSWLFGINGNNFIKTMLRLADKEDELNVVGDQYGSPTYTYDLATLLIDMIKSEKYGTYHATNEGFCNWAEFAKEIFKQTKKDVQVNTITTEEFPTRAIRPKNSRLSKAKLIENGFTTLPTWQEALAYYLNELNQGVK